MYTPGVPFTHVCKHRMDGKQDGGLQCADTDCNDYNKIADIPGTLLWC